MFKVGEAIVFKRGTTVYDMRVWQVKRLTKLKDRILLSRAVGGCLWHPVELFRKASPEEINLKKRIDPPEPVAG